MRCTWASLQASKTILAIRPRRRFLKRPIIFVERSAEGCESLDRIVRTGDETAIVHRDCEAAEAMAST
jgi:hypothetical protein